MKDDGSKTVVEHPCEFGEKTALGVIPLPERRSRRHQDRRPSDVVSLQQPESERVGESDE